MKLFPCLSVFLCLVLNSCAQSTGTKPLTIGDTIPHIILTDVVNFPVSKIQLPGTETKLTLLDFWATWCNSCVKTFPKLDSLQQKFSGEVQVILVNNLKTTGNTKEQVTAFIAKRSKTTNALQRLPVYADTAALLKQFFPHKLLPHYVWIGPAGNIIAITDAEAVTTANIHNAIRGKPLSVPVKKE